eukprot:scaffold25895_cov108-Cylindrotheca_fusiformis.AAC.2
MANAASSLSRFMLQKPQPSPYLCSDDIESSISRGVKGSTTTPTCPEHVMSKKQDMDKLLATAMNILNSEDLETALEEVNGIASTQPEDPTSLDQCLHEMNQHLMSLKNGTYYEVGEKMDLDYVADKDFRTMFLKANRFKSNGELRYNPKRAAAQMKVFFDTKYMLFGRDKLVKDITLNDLADDDRRCLEGGSFQVLPVRDRAGRLIVVNFRGLEDFKSVESELRARFYLLMSLKHSKEAQEKGLVMIYYSVGQYGERNRDAKTLQLLWKCFSSFPYHWAGVHVCSDDYRHYIGLHGVFRLMSASFAARVRVQFGNHMECLHALRGYGIPEGSLPISPTNGQMILKHHALWYQKQSMREKSPSRDGMTTNRTNEKMQQDEPSLPPRASKSAFSLETVFQDATSLPSPLHQNRSHSNSGYETHPATNSLTFPCPTDVLFGHKYKLHSGNFRLRDILAKHAADYEEAGGRRAKIEFTAQLVKKIKATGTRFLSQDKASMQWVEVTDSNARIKIAKSIRNRRRTTNNSD